MLCMLGKISAYNFFCFSFRKYILMIHTNCLLKETICMKHKKLFSEEEKKLCFKGDNLHEMSNLISWEK